ncbi:hypothetical protein NliqN6_0670 [Naganishia liquefaciens]|uniref:Uncharacterized protein n=1 Tax=Naganishia liquefaciens TaxID=104408 RepID=A0A8H3TNG9_9TREE|nr:hypothetical protein NliqN6_0670 [Naganishia liquefaciens]
MPAFQSKTNMPSIDRRSSTEPSDPPLKKNKPYWRLSRMASDESNEKGVTAKGAGSVAKEEGKKEIGVARRKKANQGETAKRRLEVEIIISKAASPPNLDDAEKDELAFDSDIDNAPSVSVSSVKADLNVVPESEEDRESQAGRRMLWETGDQESLDAMIDNLLQKDAGKEVRAMGEATKKSKTSTIDKQSAISGAALGTLKPRDALLKSGQSASYGIPDLVHAVVIKVLEHALKKNIDWFTMSKELEEEGFKNARVPTCAGKGKGRRMEGTDEHAEEPKDNTARQKPRFKLDGNYLYELFHYVSDEVFPRLDRSLDEQALN